MSENEFQNLRDALRSLVVLRGILADPVMKRLCALLDAMGGPQPQRIDAYADFAAALLEKTADFSEYLLRLVLEDVNICVLRRAKGLPVDAVLAQSTQNDLAVVHTLSCLSGEEIRACIGFKGYLPVWHARCVDFQAAYAQHLDSVPTAGYGIYARHFMFGLRGTDIVPVPRPDPVRLSDLTGYERQKQALLRNTRALLCGRPAANALLYGDAGTGKSSTVKAIVNANGVRGLRLVEVKKHQLAGIPELMETLSELPLKFILFIDDLSFTDEGDDYHAVKAVLEGSASARSANVVIYATSNRRHMVRERFSDRSGDDVNISETLQELCSLSDRFGLTVGFFKPNKDEYLNIVRALAAQHGIRMDESLLEAQAERYALGGRSPRVAQQFITQLLSTEAL